MLAGAVAGSRRRTLPGVPGNLIVNGTFADTTGWTGFGYSGKSVSGGKANFVNSIPYDGFAQDVAFVAGKYYELTYTVSGYVSGNVYVSFIGGTQVNTTFRTANGTYTQRVLAATGNTGINFRMETSGTLSIDDVILTGPYTTATIGGA